MSKLEEKIAAWRQQMAAGGVKSPAVLDEMESHLREEVEIRLAGGDSEADAFVHALKWLEKPVRVQREFCKFEGRIAAWRQQMAAGGMHPVEILEELENHLREEIDNRLAAGDSDSQAFEHAMTLMGAPELVQREFNKLANPVCLVVKISSLVWAGYVIWLGHVLAKAIPSGAYNLLCGTQVFFLSTALFTGFLVGGLAMQYVCLDCFGKLSAAPQQSIARAVLGYGRLAAALQMVAFTLALLCIWLNHGIYLGGHLWQWGGLGSSLCLLVSWGFQQTHQKNPRMRMRACIGCSILVIFFWLGSFMLDGNFAPFHFAYLWIFEAVIGLLLLLFGLGFYRRLATEKSQGESRYV